MSDSSPRRNFRQGKTNWIRSAAMWLGLVGALLCGGGLATAQVQSTSSATPIAAPAAVQSPATASANSTQPAASEEKNVAEITTRESTDTTFKVNVELVVVRVVVRDAQGRAIGTLKKEDFQLFDNGKPQTIARFAVEHKATDQPLASTGGKAEAKPNAEFPVRYVAYLFDDMHLPFQDIATSRNAALAHLNSLPPDDRVAVFTTSGIVMVDFTDDRQHLREALMRISPNPTGNATTTDCPQLTPYQADLIVTKHDPMALQFAISDYLNCLNLGPNVGTAQAESVIVSTAERLVSTSSDQSRIALGSIRDVLNKIAIMPGARTIVLVSPGFLLIDNTQREAEIIDKALRSDVIISTIDARGLYTDVDDITRRNQSSQTVAVMHQYAAQSASEESNVLSELAYGTGGSFFHNSNAFGEGFERAAAIPEYYYVLGFAPQNLKNDGKFHALKVTLANKQPYTLQSRKGYFAPTHLQNASEQAKSDINDAVFSHEDRNDMPVELHTKYFKTSDEDAKLAVLVKVDVRHLHYQKVDGRNRNDLTIVSALFDRNGNFVQGDQKTLEMRLTDETLQKKLDTGVTLRANFNVKPGTYLVRCVVRDTQGQLSATSDSVEIP